MLATTERADTLAHAKTILDGLAVPAAVVLRRPGAPRVLKLHWPEDDPGRQPAWRVLSATLWGLDGAAYLTVAPYGWPRETWVQLRWPDGPASAPGSAAAAEPPSAAAVRLVALPLPPNGADVKPPKASGDCARLVLATLYQAGGRLSASEVEIAITRIPGRKGLGFSRSTVDHTCSWLKKLGMVNNANDERGQGYGLVNPHRIPSWEGEEVWHDEGE